MSRALGLRGCPRRGHFQFRRRWGALLEGGAGIQKGRRESEPHSALVQTTIDGTPNPADQERPLHTSPTNYIAADNRQIEVAIRTYPSGVGIEPLLGECLCPLPADEVLPEGAGALFQHRANLVESESERLVGSVTTSRRSAHESPLGCDRQGPLVNEGEGMGCRSRSRLSVSEEEGQIARGQGWIAVQARITIRQILAHESWASFANLSG